MFGFKKKDPLAGLDSLSGEEHNDFDMPPTQQETGIPPEIPTQQGADSLSTPSSGDPYEMPSTFDQVREVQQPEQTQTYQQPQQVSSAPSTNVRDKDLELISSKLDVIKALVENLSQRMSAVEQRMENKKSW